MGKATFWFILFAAICTEGVWSFRHRNVSHFSSDGKIVGGSETSIESYPYQAYLLLYDGRNYIQCGGSIISHHYVVTAAHCLTNVEKVYVRIGTTTANSGGRVYETTSFAPHPKYSSRSLDYDAGVVHVEQGMELDGTNAKAIGLVHSHYEAPAGREMTITGWGATSENGQISSTLMVVQVPVVGRRQCNRQYGGGITSRMMCAGVPEGGKDSCQGDSGGPAVDTSNHRLAGITSFGVGCARPNYPGVYASVGNGEIRQFIKSQTGI